MELHELSQSVIEGDADRAVELTRAALESEADPAVVLNDGLIAAMDVVGRKFGAGEIYVPEMLLAARAMKRALELLRPLLAQRPQQSRGKVVIGTVKGDVHDIGKNIVCTMLEGSGFEVHDLGVDVAPAAFVEAVREQQPDILGLSALLTTSMPTMQKVIEELETAGVRGGLKIMVGGAPVTEEFARQIGADGYGRDAAAATDRAKELAAR